MTSSPLDPSKPVDVLMAKADPNDKENFCPAVSAEERPSVQPATPQLSSAEIETWGVMAEKMAYFHDHFKSSWTMLYNAAKSGQRPAGMFIRAYLADAISLCRKLDMHHSIEEEHIFPHLSRKMPQFAFRGQHKKEHEAMHAGLEKLEAYARKCQSGECELRMDELLAILDGFGDTLWSHMDAEVLSLGAESMKSAGWTAREMSNMPF